MIGKIILLVVIAGFVTWLTIDTTIWAVKRIKAHKQEKQKKNNNDSK